MVFRSTKIVQFDSLTAIDYLQVSTRKFEFLYQGRNICEETLSIVFKS